MTGGAANLKIRDLTVVFGKVVAVRDVSLAAREGETVAIFGANGSGETTFLKAGAGRGPGHRGKGPRRGGGRDVAAGPRAGGARDAVRLRPLAGGDADDRPREPRGRRVAPPRPPVGRGARAGVFPLSPPGLRVRGG